LFAVLVVHAPFPSGPTETEIYSGGFSKSKQTLYYCSGRDFVSIACGGKRLMRLVSFVPAFLATAFWCNPLTAQIMEPWQTAYTGEDASGSQVIAYWSFDDAGDVVKDVSGKGHDGTLAGASRRPEGRFGGGIESFPGWPVEDARHAVVVPDAPGLSPGDAFSIEMWICPKEAPADYGEAFLLDKKYVAHTDYQWIMEAPNKQGQRRLKVILGFGEDSETWWSAEPVALQSGKWTHIATTYDGAGTVSFFQDGHSLGGSTKPGRGSISPGDHPLSLGDRVGSYFHGFPGLLDEIRITAGAREFRPLTVAPEHLRTAYERLETAPLLQFRLTNNSRRPILELEAGVGVDGVDSSSYPIAELDSGASTVLEYAFDTSLRPDTYRIEVSFQFGGGDAAYADRERFTIDLVPRRPAHRMPVIMWGVGGVEGVIENLPALKAIGFSHCLGLRCDYQKIWDAGAPVQAVSDQELAASYKMLDQALVNDLGIIISVSPGHWLESKPELLRTDASGKPYARPNICGNFPEVAQFARNVGASLAQSYGAFPAFDAALIHTEVRDGTQLCFHEHDRAQYRAVTGKEYPERLGTKNGVQYGNLSGFPEDRVLPDEDGLLCFYRWFWKEGDGWNALHSAVNDGLKSTPRTDLWSFFDPAVRVPPLWGSGGNVDFLSHWTYSYPDPIRIGLAADELFAMAKGGPEGQAVMKMTQIIWYRSQTAPAENASNFSTRRSPWEDYDPDADYITISPAHLQEAFWTKIARPVKGIMYHGWQSLVSTEGPSAYRYTHPETQHALKALISEVIEPLGPTLLQVPAVPSDVAFLESFSSAMFAGRGTYGWGGSWGGDAYHVLQYAHLQPEIIYEETVIDMGLEGYKLLVLADCDVLPASVVQKIKDFQRAGGIIIGDDRLCPALAPDIRMSRYERTKQADADKAALIDRAIELAGQLKEHYQPYVASSVADVLPYRRRYGSSDYLFAINDRREFGSYVGHHRLVMEQGLDASSEFSVRRQNGLVYDLLEHRIVKTTIADGMMYWPVELEPGGGRLWLITEKPIERLAVRAAKEAQRSSAFPIEVAVTDSADTAIDAVIPMEIRISDPDGRPAELSGFYGAPGGTLDLAFAFAPNDTLGVWTIEARELASGLHTRHFVRLLPNQT